MHDELIKWLRVFCEDCKQWDGCKCCLKGECSQQKILQAADVIEDLEKSLAITLLEYQIANNKRLMTEEYAKQKPKWIPVTERLPEHHGHYLVHIEGGEFSQVSWEEIAFFDGKIFMWEHISSEYPEDVTHWMPLPEPPESEGTKWS